MKTIKDIVRDWTKEAGIKPWEETVVIHRHWFSLYIITKHPGAMIGSKGALVDKYRKILHRNCHFLFVRFVDTFAKDVKEF